MPNQRSQHLIRLLVPAAGSAILAIYTIMQIRFFALVYDAYFALILPGIVLLGCSLAIAAQQFRTRGTANDRHAAAPWLTLTAPAAAAVLLLSMHIPLDAVYSFFLIIIFLSSLYFFWASGIYALASVNKFPETGLHIAWLSGIIIGSLIEPWLMDLAGSTLHLSWILAASLSLVVIAASSRKWLLISTISATLLSVFCVYQLSQPADPLPKWSAGNQFKPILGAIASGQSMNSVASFQDSTARYDLAAMTKGQTGDTGWLLANGTSPVAVELSKHDKTYEWLKERYPLLTVPFKIVRPNRVLSIENAPGPDTSIAIATGVKGIDITSPQLPLHWLTDRQSALHQAAVIPDDDRIRFLKIPARKIQTANSGRYNIIFLPITHPGNNGWIGSGVKESHLYTHEALESYFSMLARGGMLAITTREDVLFGRMLLSAWKLLADKYGATVKPARYLLGARLGPKAPFKGSYQNLLLISKGPISATTAGRVKNSIRDIPVNLLFGINNKPVRPFGVLYHPDGLKGAETSLTQYYSRRFRAKADIAPASDARPYFFQVLRDLHPFLKWLFTALLATIILILLIPLSRHRSADATEAEIATPLPVLLGYQMLTATGLGMLCTAILQQSHGVPALALAEPFMLLVPIIIGLCAAVIASGASNRAAVATWQPWSPLLTALLAGIAGWYLGLPYGTSASWPAALQIFLIAIIFCVSGFSIGLQVIHGNLQIKDRLVALQPWAWVTIGLAALSGSILGHWVLQLHGQTVMWTAMIMCFLVSSVLGLWTWIDRCTRPSPDTP